VLRARNVPSSPHNFIVLETKAHLGPNLGLGSTSRCLDTKISTYANFLSYGRKGKHKSKVASSSMSLMTSQKEFPAWKLSKI
jgi:hypothetical protein